jgi:hypothetical protein
VLAAEVAWSLGADHQARTLPGVGQCRAVPQIWRTGLESGGRSLQVKPYCVPQSHTHRRLKGAQATVGAILKRLCAGCSPRFDAYVQLGWPVDRVSN